jgi:metal-responsive CopG/Arc/MetJ family transcriptional regulator
MAAKRVLISIDERLLARIDEATERRHTTRSAFLAEAATAQLGGSGPGADPGARAALRAIDGLHAEQGAR